jgi:hypothetical protein
MRPHTSVVSACFWWLLSLEGVQKPGHVHFDPGVLEQCLISAP